MPSAVLSELYIYPVKSLAGIKVSKWQVNEKGLLHDRKWMLIDRNNQFLSQRHIPKMALIKTQLTENSLILSTATSGSIYLPLFPKNGEEIITTIWNDQCPAKTVSSEVDTWLSDFLDTQCKLVYQADEVVRPVDQNYATSTDKVYFSDGFPFLIISDASLKSLNKEMKIQIPMLRFRPNLVISNCERYAEDSWREISINNIHFRLPKPCSRCTVPTINLETAQTTKEPLQTLNRLRKVNNHVYFGQNACHDNTGELYAGCNVIINKTGPKQPSL